MKRKLGALLLVFVLFIAVALTGCNNSNDGGQANSEPQASNEANSEESPEASSEESQDQGFVLGKTPLEFSFYGNYDWYTMNPWGEDPATKWIQDNMEVTVNAIQSAGNAGQKFNTMIVSNELPDVVWLDRGADVEKMRQAGLLVPLDDYLDKYPNLKKYAGDKTLNMLRSSDGKLYQFPNWYTNRPMGNGGYMISNKIYKELGSPKLETFDDLYAYLKLVKEKYPDVVPFEVGVSGQGLDFLYGGMKEDHSVVYLLQRGIPEGNELKSIFADPVYREYMLLASKLFREKLITQDALTQTSDQVKEKVMNGKVAVYGAYDAAGMGSEGTVALKANDPEAGYTMIWPVHKARADPNKVWVDAYDSLGWNVSVITTAAKNPEGTFAYLDWLTSPEGERIIFWGPEGMYWQGTDETEAPIYTEKYKTDVEQRTTYMAIWDTFQWAGNTAFIDGSKAANEMKLPEDQRDWATVAQQTVTWKTSFNKTEFFDIAPAPDSEEGIIIQKIGEIAEQTLAKALFAQSDDEVNALIDKAEQDAQAAGYDKVLKAMTQKWQDNLKKINGN